jgi:hypothetical protein
MTHFHLAGVLLGVALLAGVFSYSTAQAFAAAGVGVLICAALAEARRR